MSINSTDTQRRVISCPAGLDQDIEEVEGILLDRLARQDEQIAELRESHRCIEGLVGQLAAAVAANQQRLGQCEAFNEVLGRLSRVLSDEASGFTNSP